MKLDPALDQLEDAVEAAYASLKIVEWAQLNVARCVGPELNASIRSTPVDLEKLWALVKTKTKESSDDRNALSALIEEHNRKLADIIIEYRN